MSLKGGISATELYNTVDALCRGEKSALAKLSEFVARGSITAETYDEIIKQHIDVYNRKRKYRAKNRLFLVLLLTYVALNALNGVSPWLIGTSIYLAIIFVLYIYLTTQDVLSREYDIKMLKLEKRDIEEEKESYKFEVSLLKSKLEEAQRKQL